VTDNPWVTRPLTVVVEPGVVGADMDDGALTTAGARSLRPLAMEQVSGGVGRSTLEQVLSEAGLLVAGPAFATVQADRLVMCRSSASSLEAARLWAMHWAETALVQQGDLLGLVVVADAPGALPKVLRDLVRLTSGAFPKVWRLPWVEAWRRGDPPSLASAPRAVSALVADLRKLLEHRKEQS
jgi:hypothetical protein